MSVRTQRMAALALSVLLALCVGAVTGLLAGKESCTSVTKEEVAPSPSPTRSKAFDPDRSPAPGENGAVPGNPESGGADKQEQEAEPTAEPTTARVEAAASTCTTSYNGSGAIVAGLGTFLAALLVAGVAWRRGREQDAESPAVGSAPVVESAPTVPLSAVVPDAETARAVAERQSLVGALIYARDRATSRAIAERMGEALRAVGVSELAPVGVPFDPARHEAGGAMAADAAHQAGTIAAVEVVGYADRGAVIRAPVVTVYRSGSQ